jgi:polysaccharide export outer membrane protein
MNTKNFRSLVLLSLVLVAGVFTSASFAAQPPVLAPKPEDKANVPYRITRGDVLGVAVFGEADLTIGGKKVEPRGTINLQLINDIRVVGMTVGEAKVAIETAYRDGRFLRNPEVTVTIEQYAQRTVIITGQVNQPARYELPPDQQWTLKDLVMRAGGFQETAKGTAVRVTRTMPDGSLKIYEDLDVESLLRGRGNTSRNNAANFVLEPDDLVFVPQRII